jgi:hypothetical protein
MMTFPGGAKAPHAARGGAMLREGASAAAERPDRFRSPLAARPVSIA